MPQPIYVSCEKCGSEAAVVSDAHIDAEGKRIEWPKATVNADGMYFTIACKTCGQREQCIVRSDSEK
jgi:transcription elongation factor Elf1